MSIDGERTLRFCQSNRQTKESLELWGGVLTLDPGSEYSITEKIAGSLRISRSELKGSASFHRSASAVRLIEQQYYIVTFVDGGVIIFDSPLRDDIHGPSFAVSRSSGGYRAFMRCKGARTMTVHQAFVPLHMLAPFLSREAALGKPISTADGPALAAAEMLSLIFRNNQQLDGQCRNLTTRCFAQLVGQAISGVIDLKLVTRGSKLRFEEIQKYIVDNAANPEISAKSVAKKFEISSRYLSKIIAERRQTFPNMVRSAKIRLSTKLLSELPFDRYTISDIATISGFKSNPHFHRAFRSVTGTTPQQYRDAIRLHSTASSQHAASEIGAFKDIPCFKDAPPPNSGDRGFPPRLEALGTLYRFR